MSEVLIPASTVARTQFGLKIINEQPVRISQTPPNPLVTVIGTSAKDNFQVVSTSATDPFNIQAGASDDTIVTGAGADTVFGDAGNDSITTNSGNDTVLGGDGNDFLTAGDGNDFVNGDAGDEQIFGGNGNDALSGGAGNDLLNGGSGNDNLKGGAGDDILIPGAGLDNLYGGNGKDRFRFEKGSTGGSKLDKIVDFNPKQDIIEISRSLLPGSGLKKLKASDFQVVDSIGSANSTAKLIYEKSSGTVFYNPTKGVDVPLFEMKADLNGVSASNFKLF
jgi:Ca2+-binding RTX toxin-like protein